MYAYAHTRRDEETKTLTSFSSADKFFAFIRGFLDLKDYQTSLQNKCLPSSTLI